MKAFVEYIDPADAANLIAEFESLTPTLFREPGFVREYLEQPGVSTATVTLDGEKSYLIAFRVTQDKGFWVDVAKKIGGNKLDQLFTAIDELAEKFGCKYIRFTTARHGLIDQAQKHGFTAEAVLMTKPV